MEASGTGNMKLALNGALTIGTLDGANVEIREHVGAENIFIFGLTPRRSSHGGDTVSTLTRSPPRPNWRRRSTRSRGAFSPDDPDRFRDIADRIRYVDPYMTAADFAAYRAAQAEVEALWRTPALWGRAAALNIARVGWFSSDRTIAEYAADIWNVPVARR